VAWNPAVNFDHAEVPAAAELPHGVQAQARVRPYDTDLDAISATRRFGVRPVFITTTSPPAARNAQRHQATGPPATHIPTALRPMPLIHPTPLQACHTRQLHDFSAPDESPAVTPPMLCANCHEPNFFASHCHAPVHRKGGGASATGDCGLCHTSTASFALGN